MKQLDSVLKAFADINRVRILKLLESRPMCVCELAYVLDVSQPAVSKQLKKLVQAGVIESMQDGVWTNYFVRPTTSYARSLLKNMKQWLNGDAVIIADRKKAKTAKRTVLYSKK